MNIIRGEFHTKLAKYLISLSNITKRLKYQNKQLCKLR